MQQALFLLPIPKTYRGRYAMHKYWSKKPHEIISALIEQYTNPNDIVLDPFCGSGVTVIEAVRLNRRAVGIDINPAALRQTQAGLRHVSLEHLKAAFDHIKKTVRPMLHSLYAMPCPVCEDPNATMTHMIWYKDTPIEARVDCIACQNRSHIHSINPLNLPPIPSLGPSHSLWKNSRLNIHEDVTTKEFFTKRNCYSLDCIKRAIEDIPQKDLKETLELCFTGALSQASKMVVVIRNRRKKARQAQVGSWTTGFWLPEEYFEIHPWRCFENRFKKILNAQKEIGLKIPPVSSYTQFEELQQHQQGYCIKIGNASALTHIPDDSIDYLLTDPPHGNRIPYLELSHLWNDWLNIEPDWENEIIVSEAKARNKTIDDYRERLYQACQEWARILRPDKKATIIFNARDFATWEILLEGLTKAGFLLETVQSAHYSTGSLAQDTRSNALTYDLILTCRLRAQISLKKILPLGILIKRLQGYLTQPTTTHTLLYQIMAKAQQQNLCVSAQDFLVGLKTIGLYRKTLWSLKKN